MCNERRPAVETTPRFKREASRADEAEPRSMRVVSSKGVRGGKEVGRGALESSCADRKERWKGHGEGGQRLCVDVRQPVWDLGGMRCRRAGEGAGVGTRERGWSRGRDGRLDNRESR